MTSPAPPAGPRGATRVHVLMLLAALWMGASGSFAWHTMQSPMTNSLAARSGGVELVAVQPSPPSGPRPVRVDIPNIQVTADLEELRRNFNGELSTPAKWADAGWYAEGVLPGQRGPAVIVGHRDSAAEGPAVFYRLDSLSAGNEVFVDNSDGTRQRFVVDDTQRFAKTQFPTALIYGPTALAELRLITCAGSFDSAERSYTDNLVVTAHAE
jgi:sortase (surface protein transpeptidase)